MKLFHTDFEGKTIKLIATSERSERVTQVLLRFTDDTEIMIGVGEGGQLVSSPVVKATP